MGIRLVRHAFQTVFGNLREALTISIVPYALILIFTILAGISPAVVVPSVGQSLGALLIVVISLAAFGYIAASWHRYVLLEETPQVFGGPAVGRALPYIGNSFLLGLWLLLFLVPIMLVFGFVFMPMMGAEMGMGMNPDGTMPVPEAPGIGGLIAQVVIGTIIGTLALAYGLVLPASALNETMTFRTAREYAMPLIGDIAIVALILSAINAIAVLILFHIAMGGLMIIYFVLNVIMQWVLMMVGISILTTLYGHLVQGRDLPT